MNRMDGEVTAPESLLEVELRDLADGLDVDLRRK
jgi:hypothetical protein